MAEAPPPASFPDRPECPPHAPNRRPTPQMRIGKRDEPVKVRMRPIMRGGTPKSRWEPLRDGRGDLVAGIGEVFCAGRGGQRGLGDPVLVLGLAVGGPFLQRGRFHAAVARLTIERVVRVHVLALGCIAEARPEKVDPCFRLRWRRRPAFGVFCRECSELVLSVCLWSRVGQCVPRALQSASRPWPRTGG